MKYTFPKLLFTLSILFVLFSSALFLFLYIQINKNNGNSEQLLAQSQDAEAKAEDMKMLQSTLQSVADERASLATHFAQSSDVVPFLDMIEKLAPESGAKAQVVLVDAPTDNSGLVVQVKATGSFEAVYKFLTLLENSPYELEFNSMDLQAADTGDVKTKKLPQWSATFTIKLLSFVQ